MTTEFLRALVTPVEEIGCDIGGAPGGGHRGQHQQHFTGEIPLDPRCGQAPPNHNLGLCRVYSRMAREEGDKRGLAGNAPVVEIEMLPRILTSEEENLTLSKQI